MTMELKIGEYFIPEGCTIKRTGNTIKVYQKKQQRDPSILRCRDCKFFSFSSKSKWPRIDICLARTWGKTIKRNYVVSPSNKACDKFERKEE